MKIQAKPGQHRKTLTPREKTVLASALIPRQGRLPFAVQRTVASARFLRLVQPSKPLVPSLSFCNARVHLPEDRILSVRSTFFHLRKSYILRRIVKSASETPLDPYLNTEVSPS